MASTHRELGEMVLLGGGPGEVQMEPDGGGREPPPWVRSLSVW